MLKPVIFFCFFILSAESVASLSIPGLALTEPTALALHDKTLARTGLSVNEDDTLPGQDASTMKLTEAQLHEAQVWGLDEAEEKRYVQLMQNRSGIYYEGLRQTPIDILGINARSEHERNHFAKLAAVQEAQKISKNIAWNNAFYKAYNELFRGVPVVDKAFDPAPFAPGAYKPVTLDPKDRLYLFVKPTDAITSVLMALIEAIDTTPDTQLNLMLLDADDIGIQQWASRHQIPRHLVASGRISLNHGELNFDALTMDKKSTPLLLLTRLGHSSVVDLGAF